MRTMNTLRRIAPLFALLVVALVSLGCPPSTPTTVPPAPVVATPPQITVANAVNALAQAVDGAVTSAIAARDAGKADASDVAAIESFAAAIARTGKLVNAELRSPDSWEVQRVKILQIVAGSGLGALKAHISPGAQLLVSSLVLLVNEVLTAVGVPTI